MAVLVTINNLGVSPVNSVTSVHSMLGQGRRGNIHTSDIGTMFSQSGQRNIGYRKYRGLDKLPLTSHTLEWDL